MRQNDNNSHLETISMQNLSDLKLKDKATVIRVDVANVAARQKLFACGLIPGALISVIRVAPLGDPIQIQLSTDVVLCIRKEEAKYVKVNCSNR